MKTIFVIVIVLVLFYLALNIAAWRGFGDVSYCGEEKMIERRFGVDRPLSEAEFAPVDHIVYTRPVRCPRTPRDETFWQFLKATHGITP